MLEAIGYLGAIMLGICAVPEVIRSIKYKKCFVGDGFLSLWGLGEILLFIYVLPTKDVPLLLNYSFNLLLISILGYYRIVQGNTTTILDNLELKSSKSPAVGDPSPGVSLTIGDNFIKAYKESKQEKKPKKTKVKTSKKSNSKSTTHISSDDGSSTLLAAGMIAAAAYDFGGSDSGCGSDSGGGGSCD